MVHRTYGSSPVGLPVGGGPGNWMVIGLEDLPLPTVHRRATNYQATCISTFLTCVLIFFFPISILFLPCLLGLRCVSAWEYGCDAPAQGRAHDLMCCGVVLSMIGGSLLWGAFIIFLLAWPEETLEFLDL